MHSAVNKSDCLRPAAALVMLHTPANAGYAIAPLERTFVDITSQLTGQAESVHIAYAALGNAVDAPVPSSRVHEFDFRSRDSSRLAELTEMVSELKVEFVLGFDHQVGQPIHRALRRGGVKKIVSYSGAPMSSLNSGPVLLAKRLQVLGARSRPEMFIFESEAMRKFATNGRGIPRSDTSVVPLGVDTTSYLPSEGGPAAAYSEFGIPPDRKVFIYTGHMEERKGVHVIMRAARHLVEQLGRRDLQFLILGNREGEDRPLLEILGDSAAREFVTFGGYRRDIAALMRGCWSGIIPSTGWDSFPRSSLEMQASGLPLIASRLQGLVETLEDGKTGFLFEAGDHEALAALIVRLADNDHLRNKMSSAARDRVASGFTIDQQRRRLLDVVERVWFDS